MASSLVVVTPPASEPLTLDEAKLHLRVTTDDDDDHISRCISAARQHAEVFLNRALLTTTFRLRADSFPDLPNATLKYFTPTYSVESYLARAISLMSGPIYVPRPPFQSVVSFTFVDPNGVTQNLPVFDGNFPTDQTYAYVLDSDAEPARIAPAYQLPWPVTLAQQGVVNLTWKAGYTSVALIPQTIMQAMLMLISHFYENREPYSEKPLSPVALAGEALLWDERVYEIPA